MVLEATIICLDNSEWARNGDYFPTRWQAQQEAAGLLIEAKTGQNPESAVGVLTMAGKRVDVLTAPTQDVGKVLASVQVNNICDRVDFKTALSIAHLALKHRSNKSQKQRIVCFIGSPVEEDERKLIQLGKMLKKNNVALDIVAFGYMENMEKLEKLKEAVNSSDNSHLVSVPAGVGSLADSLIQTPVFQGDDIGPGGMPGNLNEYGINEETDPEMAMAIRISMEEQKAKQEAEAAAAQNPAEQPAADAPAEEVDAEAEEEKRVLEEALKLSMEPAEEQKPDPGAQVFQDKAFLEDLLGSLPDVDPTDASIQNVLKQMQGEEGKQEEPMDIETPAEGEEKPEENKDEKMDVEPENK